ncbi:MAG: phosphate ABC transporter ATP-binding protein [Pseudomonadota bacterium]
MFDEIRSGKSFTFNGDRHGPGRPKAMTCRKVNVWYGDKHALIDVDLDLHQGEVTALIGPSGCGKSTFLKCLNRMHEATPGARVAGDIRLYGEDVYAPEVDPPLLRRRFGWVAQKPNPFPSSVKENVVYGARLAGLCNGRAEEDELAERLLREAGLWDEVKDRLDAPGTNLSGGQQQRLCIARALSTDPDILLMDEPCSAIDPIAAARVERLVERLRRERAVVVITHNMEQAARLSQKAAFFHLGRLVEAGDARALFTEPRAEETRRYLAGRFG